MDKSITRYLPEIKELMQVHGVEKAYLFGSAAKGTMHEKSDIDIIIRFPPGMNYSNYSQNYFALAEALEKLLNKKVELVTERTLKNPYLLRDINQYKVALL